MDKNYYFTKRYKYSVFYKIGVIESWGRGICKINKAFDKATLERPVFKESEGGLLVTFGRNYPTMEKTISSSKDDGVNLARTEILILKAVNTNRKSLIRI